MSKKKLGKDEEVLRFAIKIVGPIALVFVGAIGVDIIDAFSWFESASFDGGDIVSEIEYQWYMLF